MNKVYEKRGYLLDEFRLFHLKDTYGTTVDYHYHEFPKIILLWKGSGSYAIHDKRYALEEHDILLIGSHCIHRPEFERGILYERTIIYISPEFLEKQSTVDCDLKHILQKTTGNVIRTKDNLKIFTLIKQLEQELSEEQYGRSVISNALLLAILVEIGRILQNRKDDFTNQVSTSNPHVLEMMRYIDKHLTEELNISQLAEQFYLSQYHMMHLFKKETGQSVYEYIVFKRILYAKELISKGVSATESCYNSGFKSYSSFTRAYAKYLGSTPTGRKINSVQRDETFE